MFFDINWEFSIFIRFGCLLHNTKTDLLVDFKATNCNLATKRNTEYVACGTERVRVS